MGDDDHMLRPWPILKSDQIGDFKVFSLNAIQKKSPRTGMNTVYYVLNTVDWVNTIAITPNQELVMVEQFRHATNTLELELPGGMMDKLEQDPVMAACRELREETGYIAKNWESLGYIFTTFGICDEKLYLFKATGLTFDKPDPDEGEILDYFELPLSEVQNLIKNGTINDAKTICAIARSVPACD